MENPVAPTTSESNRGANRRRRRGGQRQTRPQAQTQPLDQTQQPSNPNPQPHPHIVGARPFGGQLTRLHGDAPAFIPASLPPPSTLAAPAPPGKSNRNHQRKTPAASRPHPPDKPQPRRGSIARSTAPDIVTRIHEDISHNVYECAICTNEVSRNSKIWSCKTCWTVFHIGCIKKWSKNEGSAVHRPPGQDDDEAQVGKQWRCPGCNLPKDITPTSYTCWCEKEIDPKTIPGLPPHSCGQTCGRERKFPKPCPHPCDLLCHAGPCPPCSAMGPKQSCFCGKEETTLRCLETNYDSGWSCGAVCGDLMPCGQHTCQRPCHEGLCGACPVEVNARCYCGRVEKMLQCHDQEEEKESSTWTGTFDCGGICARALDCGVHTCQKSCHPHEMATPHCPRSVDMVTHCPCGKTALVSLKTTPRQNCTDPIPCCKEVCGRQLKCGHQCLDKCHPGDCNPCSLEIATTCRCGRNQFNVICHDRITEPPQCNRSCKATLNCGRHDCGEKCCTGDRKAAERQATKRKLKTLDVLTRALDEDIEAEHICTRVCGRKLKCGNHTCPDLCHRGPCGSCKEAIFDDISCTCGRTVLQAPLPCGTQPPPCNFPCNRSKDCAHPQVAHNCHSDDEECPKCPFLTEKQCLCSKKTLKNQPCWRADVLCGLICGRTLKCGSHQCRKTCHRPGECEDAQQHCQQECGKAKKSCGHPCEQTCHAPSACKEEKACPFKVMITCDCQRKKEEVRCNARAGMAEASGRQNSLKCDDECARLERNRNLARALHVSDDHTDDHVPYSTTTLTMYLEDVAWAHKQEAILRVFAADDQEKRYRFPPMRNHQRAFIHSLAEDFGFDGESLDPEPHRHVLLFKTPKFVSAPMKTLAQAARIKRPQLNVSAPVQATKPPKPADEARYDYNGLLLEQPKFGLTEDEVHRVIQKTSPTMDFDTIFLPNDQGVALLLLNRWESPTQLTGLLSEMRPTVAEAISKDSLASSVTLAMFDLSGLEPKIVHQAGKSGANVAHGWSQVAAKRAAPMQAPQIKPVGQRPIYTVLGSRLAEAKKKKQENEELLRRKMAQEEVVDDWEKEAELDEGGGDGGEAEARTDGGFGDDTVGNSVQKV
ncbi:hypothetical protein PV10_02121 [Exophiala mesophila]|uniref:R3H domain-containing protein n=1 Tax=Exophiala mesophila TaxID=212818 RepID=A0A0D1ZIB0_EXOME|nr:uncharacterized protein PV10_02121 [Exophiala mesophila]KIV94347.1 hypothetical protein PV10_02121 [Exophiala mesophila]